MGEWSRNEPDKSPSCLPRVTSKREQMWNELSELTIQTVERSCSPVLFASLAPVAANQLFQLRVYEVLMLFNCVIVTANVCRSYLVLKEEMDRMTGVVEENVATEDVYSKTAKIIGKPGRVPLLQPRAFANKVADSYLRAVRALLNNAVYLVTFLVSALTFGASSVFDFTESASSRPASKQPTEEKSIVVDVRRSGFPDGPANVAARDVLEKCGPATCNPIPSVGSKEEVKDATTTVAAASLDGFQPQSKDPKSVGNPPTTTMFPSSGQEQSVERKIGNVEGDPSYDAMTQAMSGSKTSLSLTVPTASIENVDSTVKGSRKWRKVVEEAEGNVAAKQEAGFVGTFDLPISGDLPPEAIVENSIKVRLPSEKIVLTVRERFDAILRRGGNSSVANMR